MSPVSSSTQWFDKPNNIINRVLLGEKKENVKVKALNFLLRPLHLKWIRHRMNETTFEQDRSSTTPLPALINTLLYLILSFSSRSHILYSVFIQFIIATTVWHITPPGNIMQLNVQIPFFKKGTDLGIYIYIYIQYINITTSP